MSLSTPHKETWQISLISSMSLAKAWKILKLDELYHRVRPPLFKGKWAPHPLKIFKSSWASLFPLPLNSTIPLTLCNSSLQINSTIYTDCICIFHRTQLFLSLLLLLLLLIFRERIKWRTKSREEKVEREGSRGAMYNSMSRINSVLLPMIALFFWVFSSSVTADVSYDDKAFIIDGHRKILISGSIHYPRSTPEVQFIFVAAEFSGQCA